jgi:hypothetical protein
MIRKKELSGKEMLRYLERHQKPELNKWVEKRVFREISNLKTDLVKLNGMVEHLASYQHRTLKVILRELREVIENLQKEFEHERRT